MIDTVRLKSPYLSAEVAAIIEQQLKHRSAVVISTGEVEWELTSGELVGSYDNRIMVRLCREELVYEPVVKSATDRGWDARSQATAFTMRPCEPYLVVEGSVHKAMVGHNITGGPQCFQAAASWFINLIGSDLLAVCLPSGLEWLVERVDVTETYNLPYEAIEEFIGSLNRVEYPRRKRRSYGLEALQFSGTTTSFSLYHKGPEFAVHDGKKLKKRLDPDEVKYLQGLANGIMRMEISVKSKKLKADVASGLLGVKGEKVRVVQVTNAYLQRVHDQEVARVIREGHKDMTTVRLEKEVSARLFEMYNPQLAGSLYGLWVRLSAHGEKEVKKTMKLRTFYLQRKQLAEAGCSWAGTDIVIRHSSIPVGFTLRRADPRCDTIEDAKITELLSPWRQAV